MTSLVKRFADWLMLGDSYHTDVRPVIKQRIITDLEFVTMHRAELLMWQAGCYNMLGIGPFKWIAETYDPAKGVTILEWEPSR